MKLRNKKTGEITTRIDVSESGEKFWVLGKKPCMYDTLAELNEDWEDYEPAEPLIKDDKIRKAVRAWADIVGDNLFRVWHKEADEFGCIESRNGRCMNLNCEPDYICGDYEWHTIAELCGEEEE